MTRRLMEEAAFVVITALLPVKELLNATMAIWNRCNEDQLSNGSGTALAIIQENRALNSRGGDMNMFLLCINVSSAGQQVVMFCLVACDWNVHVLSNMPIHACGHPPDSDKLLRIYSAQRHAHKALSLGVQFAHIRGSYGVGSRMYVHGCAQTYVCCSLTCGLYKRRKRAHAD